MEEYDSGSSQSHRSYKHTDQRDDEISRSKRYSRERKSYHQNHRSSHGKSSSDYKTTRMIHMITAVKDLGIIKIRLKIDTGQQTRSELKSRFKYVSNKTMKHEIAMQKWELHKDSRRQDTHQFM